MLRQTDHTSKFLIGRIEPHLFGVASNELPFDMQRAVKFKLAIQNHEIFGPLFVTERDH